MNDQIAELSTEQLEAVVGGETCKQLGMSPTWTALGSATGGIPIAGFGTRAECRGWVKENGL
jgi:hypothetical protein